jgi:bile acid-coenzyme A ligase
MGIDSMQPTPIGRIMSELAADEPDRPWLTVGEVTKTRRELDASVNRLARAYAGLGVELGDFVTIALPNGIEFLQACGAAWKLGAVPQPISWRLPAVERDAIIELADPALVVGIDAAELPGRACVPAGFVPDPSLDDGPLPDAVSPSLKAPTSGGSTGRPKLIVSGQTGEVAPGGTGLVFGMDPDDTQLVCGPLYHNGPFVYALAGMMLGQHLVILERFDAAEALAAIDRHQVSWLNLVPTMMQRMLRAMEAGTEADLGSIRRLWHMAAPCPAWLKQAWIDRLGPERVWELYGGTEAQSFTTMSGQEWLDHPGTVGRPVFGQMVVLDEQGHEVEPGVHGEIYMRPPEGVPPTYRYVGAEVRAHGAWESLGDLGWIDADGYVYLGDRRTDMILSGGANIYPAEVEGALLACPGVVSCAVVGLPDDDLGERVHAVVQTDGSTTVDAILAELGERLVRYKVPRSVELVDDPLRDDAGKVRRSAVRAAVIERTAGSRP